MRQCLCSSMGKAGPGQGLQKEGTRGPCSGAVPAALHAHPRSCPTMLTSMPVGMRICVHAHRFVRQGSELWKSLHQGILTTGNLKDALGFREAGSARIVGCAQQVRVPSIPCIGHHLLVCGYPFMRMRAYSFKA